MTEIYANTLVGSRVFFWHFGKLTEAEVTSTFQLNGSTNVDVLRAFATAEFYTTRNEAVEVALSQLANAVLRWSNLSPQDVAQSGTWRNLC